MQRRKAAYIYSRSADCHRGCFKEEWEELGGYGPGFRSSNYVLHTSLLHLKLAASHEVTRYSSKGIEARIDLRGKIDSFRPCILRKYAFSLRALSSRSRFFSFWKSRSAIAIRKRIKPTRTVALHFARLSLLSTLGSSPFLRHRHQPLLILTRCLSHAQSTTSARKGSRSSGGI